MSIEDIVDVEEKRFKEEKPKEDVVYDSYRNKTNLNIIMTDAELVPLPKGIYGMHIPETGHSYVNQGLRGDVVQRYRTEIHESLHKILLTSSEYVVRTLEAFISGVEILKDRYTKKPRYIF